jgi:hypothetical protein
MPIIDCSLEGRPGYKYGSDGTCYPYEPGSDSSRMAAKKKAIQQALAVRYQMMRAGKTPEAITQKK